MADPQHLLHAVVGPGRRHLARALPERLERGALGRRRLAVEAGIALVVWTLAGHVVEYSHLGLLMIPLYMLAMAHLHRSGNGVSNRLASTAMALPVLIVAG